MKVVVNAEQSPRVDRPSQSLSFAPSYSLPATHGQRSAGSVTCIGILDGKVRDVETVNAEKGAGLSSWMKGEFAPAPERAAQYPCFWAPRVQERCQGL